MKILLCTLEYPPQIGGVANYYANLVAAWPKADEWTVMDNSHKTLIGHGPLAWRRSIGALIKAQRQKHYDLIFLGQILPLGTAALIAGVFTSFKSGIFLHGMDLTFALRTPRKRFLSKIILKKAKHIVCANTKVQAILLDFLPEVKEKIILLQPGAVADKPNPVLTDRIREKYKLAGKKILFSIGRLVKRKGFDQVISALSIMGGDDWFYLIAGDGPEKENLQAQAAASPIADKVIFLGVLSEEEKWSSLNLCDIFITTSRDLDGDFEGFGIVYLEANLLGKPVIAGRSGGVGDAVIDGLNGILVNPEKPEEIAAAIKKLLANETERKFLGENGRARAVRDFSWPGQAHKLSEIIK